MDYLFWGLNLIQCSNNWYHSFVNSFLLTSLVCFYSPIVMEPSSSSTGAPSIFIGNDYAHWKVCMRAHLKGLNDNVWIIVKKGWAKPEEEYVKWYKVDFARSNWNNLGYLSVIFNCLLR